MKLHKDVNVFRVLLNDIHNRTGYRLDVLEKDYYVVLMLEELAKLQDEGLPAYFKGGAGNNQHVISAYETMQRQYVLRECDRIPYENALDALRDIKCSLKKNNAWNKALIPNQEETETIRYG